MTKEEQIERMRTGRIYVEDSEELSALQAECINRVDDYNETRPSEKEKRKKLLKDNFAEIGENCYIEPPYHANWGGRHVHIKDHFYANFNLTLVDDVEIFIGDHVMFGPNVTLCTATHPISPKYRLRVAQYNKPIHIGNNVWIGANTVVLPGVTIGDNTVIGANSLVTKDIPANVVAYGSPCKVQREITEEDDSYYDKTKKFDI